MQYFKSVMYVIGALLILFMMTGCEDTCRKSYTCDQECREWLLKCVEHQHMTWCKRDAQDLGISKEVRNENVSLGTIY